MHEFPKDFSLETSSPNCENSRSNQYKTKHKIEELSRMKNGSFVLEHHKSLNLCCRLTTCFNERDFLLRILVDVFFHSLKTPESTVCVLVNGDHSR